MHVLLCAPVISSSHHAYSDNNIATGSDHGAIQGSEMIPNHVDGFQDSGIMQESKLFKILHFSAYY